jgi:hypothetical protein
MWRVIVAAAIVAIGGLLIYVGSKPDTFGAQRGVTNDGRAAVTA